jgi:hypothetical protein
LKKSIISKRVDRHGLRRRGKQTPDLERILKLKEVTENDHRQARVAVYIYLQQGEP